MYQLTSTDGFASANVVKTAPTLMNFPTTGIVVDKKYYVLNAKLDEIFNPNAPKTSDFLIQEIKF